MSFSIPKRQQMAGQLAILAAASFWSTSGLFIKLLDWHPVVIAGSRSFFGAVFLMAVRLISPPRGGGKKSPAILWMSAFIFALTIFTFVISNKLTTAANAILLQYSAPIWAAILGWAMAKEKPRWEHWAALVLVMGGLLLFFRDSLGSGAFIGNALSIISGVLLGAHMVSLRMLKDCDPRDAMLLAHSLTAAMSVPFIILYPPVIKLTNVLAILYMGLLQMGFSSLLLSYGIVRVTAIQAMLTAILDPILSPVWVFLATGERPTLYALIGGLIIISAVVASSLIGFTRKETPY